MRLTLAVLVIATASCGKEVNPDYCDAHPTDEICLGAPQPDAPGDGPPDVAPAECPADYDTTLAGSSSTYRVVDTASLWAAAEADCADDSLVVGAYSHLIVLGSDGERTALTAHASLERHVGHSDAITDGVWKAVTDEAATYVEGAAPYTLPWLVGQEPNGTGNCAVLGTDLTLRDRDCAIENAAYICECDRYAENPANF